MQDGNKRGNCGRRGEETLGNSVLWTQFFCKPQSSLKNSLFKKQTKKLLMLIAFLIKKDPWGLPWWHSG